MKISKDKWTETIKCDLVNVLLVRLMIIHIQRAACICIYELRTLYRFLTISPNSAPLIVFLRENI